MHSTPAPTSTGPTRDYGLLAILAACLLAFGAFLPWHGFYQDDWHFIYYANQGLSKLWELSAYDDRPFASWPYITGFALFGFRPLLWQAAGLILRWLTAGAFWLFLRTLWPGRARLMIVPALLFAIYPLYTLQAMPVTYITHWVCFLLYFISLWLMVIAVRDPQRWPLLILAVMLDGIQLFTIEYFNGIELLRPVVLWLALAPSVKSSREHAQKTFAYWMPFLLLLIAFVYWRGFVFQSPDRDTNAPTIFRELLTSPLETTLYLAGAVLKDTLLILPGAWSSTLVPALVDFSPAGLVILLLAVFTFVAGLIYLLNLNVTAEGDPPLYQFALLGALGLLLGPIPAWVTHQPLYDTNPLWNSRLGMASMFGAAMLVTWIVESLIKTSRQRALVYALLLALSASSLLRWGNIYRNAWTTEKSFLNQLAWRAPGLEPGTPIVSDGELLPLMGDYPTAFSINMLYTQPPGAERALAWYFPVYGNDTTSEKIASGSDLTERKFSTRFSGSAARLIPVWYDPTVSDCLHVLTSDDSVSRLYSDLLRSVARRADPSRISTASMRNDRIFEQALALPDNWCRYYQEADLAAQQKNWDEVIKIWQDAETLGYSPTYGPELLPFIRAMLTSGDRADATRLSETAASLTSTQAMRQTLCHLWSQAGELPDTDLSGLLRCEQPPN